MAFTKQIRSIAAAASFALAALMLFPAVARADAPAPFGDSAWDRGFAVSSEPDSHGSSDDAFHDDATFAAAPEIPAAPQSGALIPMPSGFGLGAVGLIIAALVSRKLNPRAA
jgi:hypothetical protein